MWWSLGDVYRKNIQFISDMIIVPTADIIVASEPFLPSPPPSPPPPPGQVELGAGGRREREREIGAG